MLTMQAMAVLVINVWILLRRLGGPGLMLVALADSTLLPIPGSADVLTIVLAAHNHSLWPYYAFLTTAGSMVGGYVTYRLGRKGGERALEKKFPEKTLKNIYRQVERHSFMAVFGAALLPPPFPLSPFLLTAGTLNVPRPKFLAALAAGRGARFFLFAFLAAHYGRRWFVGFGQYRHPILATLIVLSAAGTLAAYVYFLRRRWQGKPEFPGMKEEERRRRRVA